MAAEKRERKTAPVEGRRGEGSRRGSPDAPSLPPALDETATRAARSSCTILITGETGVGKGFMAKWLHQASPRRDRAFIPVNCGAIPESIIDSQLFGHVRGAFSGAHADHLGLVRAAQSGTLFLDEVGELPPSAQTRLLRLLQDQEVQPVGHARPIVVDVRIMAATNGDLREAVNTRGFREDLLFRLDVVRIHVAPLRERLGELDGLLDLFNREFADLYRQPALDFETAALGLLHTYHWPGNIRQLRTVVERLHVLCPGERITAERLVEVGHRGDLPDQDLGRPPRRSGAALGTGRLADDSLDPSGSPMARAARAPRHEEVLQVLHDNEGSVARAAAVFGVHRSTIYRWLQQRGDHTGTASRKP